MTWSSPREAGSVSADAAIVERPGWVRLSDLLTILLVCASAWVALSGGMRTSIGTFRLSITSATRLLVLAAVVAIARHLVRRRPSLIDVVRAIRVRWPSEAWRATGLVWAVSRLAVVLTGYFAVLLIGFEQPPPKFQISENIFVNLPARWDAGWYLDIASNGYRWYGGPYRQQNVAFFPAFPMAMRAAGVILGARAPGVTPIETQLRMLVAGWLLAIGVFWYALVYVYRWASLRAGPDVATATVALLAAYPFAVFFSAPYTEALFLLSTTAALFHFERGEWMRAGCWGFVVGLVRPNGVLLTIPLLVFAAQKAIRAEPAVRRALAPWLALAAPAFGLVLYSIFIHHLSGRFLAWSEVQAAWGRSYQLTTWIGLELTEMSKYGAVHYVEGAPVTLLNGLGGVLALALLWPLGRLLGTAYVLFVLVNLVPAVLSGGLMSVGRFSSTLFPLFYVLGARLSERQHLAWIVGFSVLQGLLAVLFFTWRPPF